MTRARGARLQAIRARLLSGTTAKECFDRGRQAMADTRNKAAASAFQQAAELGYTDYMGCMAAAGQAIAAHYLGMGAMGALGGMGVGLGNLAATVGDEDDAKEGVRLLDEAIRVQVKVILDLILRLKQFTR